MSPWPGNQWHGVGNESCDGRGRPHQLLSLCVYSVYSLHPGSCWDLGGVLSAGAGMAPAHSWTMESPLGPLLGKTYRAPRHAVIPSINACHFHGCVRGGELSHFQTRVRPHIRNLSERSSQLIFLFLSKTKWQSLTNFVREDLSLFFLWHH